MLLAFMINHFSPQHPTILHDAQFLALFCIQRHKFLILRIAHVTIMNITDAHLPAGVAYTAYFITTTV